MSDFETRVWTESGDLVGAYSVERAGGWHNVLRTDGERFGSFRGAQAEYRARNRAVEVAAELADETRAACPADDHDRCGVLAEHGISLQICADGYDVTSDPRYNV